MFKIVFTKNRLNTHKITIDFNTFFFTVVIGSEEIVCKPQKTFLYKN